ncbi:MAG: class I SAM-dependent methyltransferase, partial [Gemmatimonadales bacterium]|nr:class I SAM-dependent methyltransferase [Gemmatimonadales bacterium]
MTRAVSGELVARLEAAHGREAVAAQLRQLARHGAAVEDPDRWLELALAKQFQPTGLEVVPQCACGSRELDRVGWFEFWNLLGLARCRICGTTVVTPRLDLATVQRIFAESYFAEEGADPRYWGRRRMPVFEEVHRLLRRFGVKRVFDVGCAYGHLLSYLRDRGMAVAGCDLSPAVVAWGRRELHLDLHAGSVRAVDAPAGAFDAVVCLDTLYYAHDPIADLKAMRRLLAPDGVLLLRLRNRLTGRMRPADAARGLVYPPMSVEHLWGFTPRS